MSADPIVYCLEKLTDYDAFERLCSDVMASSGYSQLEPLGGRKDKGRDAILLGRGPDEQATVFAYSVRSDWRVKLAEDCETIRANRHNCNAVVFVCVSAFTAGQRDEAVDFVRRTFGWTLELYGVERLRMLLATTCRHLVERHASIFSPPFFPAAPGSRTECARDVVVLDYVDADVALAHWLARRLEVAGYSQWCRTLSPTVGRAAHDMLLELAKDRAFRYVSIVSPASLADADHCSRRAIVSASWRERVVGVEAQSVDHSGLDSHFKRSAIIRFDNDWAAGLRELLDALSASGCPRRIATAVPLEAFFPRSAVSPEPEDLVSNCFPIRELPKYVSRFVSDLPVSIEASRGLQIVWAFRRTGFHSFVAFEPPPKQVASQFLMRKEAQQRAGGQNVFDLPSRDLIPELLRKALLVRCSELGLSYCDELNACYFTEELGKRLTFSYRGTSNWVSAAGSRAYGAGRYKYSLAPDLTTRHISELGRCMLVRVRVRIADVGGEPLTAKQRLARRKHLCKAWWNGEWRKRILAVAQFLASGSGQIRIGTSGNEIAIDSLPSEVVAPCRLDEQQLGDAEQGAPDPRELEEGDDDPA